MRVVIDCNVLVSAAYSDGVCRRVVNEAVASHEVVLSEPVLAEYETVASRPKHERYRDRLLNVVRLLRNIAITVEPADTSFGLADPDDEVYLATGAAGRAALVTGNRRHFTEPRYGPVEVLSPRAFLDRVAA